MDYVRSTPLGITNAPVGDQKRICQSQFFDGILAIGNSIGIVEICKVLYLRKTMKIDLKTPKKFKGISLLEDFHQIYEISLAYVGSMELSMLLCSEGSPHHEIKFNDVLANIYSILHAAILKRGHGSRSSRLLIQRSFKEMNIFPQDWINFVQDFDSLIHQSLLSSPILFPTNCTIKFSAQRMGQDISLRDFKIQELSAPYQVLNLKCVSSLAIHSGLDFNYDNSDHVLMWNLEELTLRLGKPLKTFNVFLLPGLGNVTYEFPGTADGNGSRCKFLQLYFRCGHEIHRDKSGFFKRPIFAKRLASLQSVFFSSSIKDQKLNTNDNVMLGNRINKPINGIIKHIDLCPTNRSEIVWEQTKYISHLGLENAMSMALSTTKEWILSFQLNDVRFIKVIPTEVLQNWLKLILLPCMSSIEVWTNISKNAKPSQALDNKRTVIDNDWDISRSNKEVTINIDSIKICSIKDYIEVLMAEAIITMTLRGRLSSEWPAWIGRTLGFDLLEKSIRSDTYAIRCVLFKKKIECTVPEFAMTLLLPSWLIGSTKLNLLKGLLQNLKLKKPEIKLHEIADELVKLMGNVLVTQHDITLDSSTLTEINLPYLKTLNSNCTNAKMVRFVTDFFETPKLFKHKIEPAGLVTLITSIHDSIMRKTKENLLSQMAKICENKILSHKMPLYLRIRNSSPAVLALLPCPIINIAGIINEAYCWRFDKQINEIGRTGVSMLKLIRMILCQTGENKIMDANKFMCYVQKLGEAVDQNAVDAILAEMKSTS